MSKSHLLLHPLAHLEPKNKCDTTFHFSVTAQTDCVTFSNRCLFGDPFNGHVIGQDTEAGMLPIK